MHEREQQGMKLIEPILHGQLIPLSVRVQSNPEHRMVRLILEMGVGQVEVIFDADEDTGNMIEALRQAHQKAKIGLVIPKGNGKGIVGGSR